ncbi:MAG: molybdopterin biosynthesis protein [Planctomycetes bacterium]|nr:molybdopterin biosynthesis protein [Planctomycetota bacterium]
MTTPEQPGSVDVAAAARQQQFLEVVSRDEAAERFRNSLSLERLGGESVSLHSALGRMLAADVVSDVDVSGFDRSNVDGFAIRAADTFGVMEEEPRALDLNGEVLAPGVVPEIPVAAGTATTIATGGMIPRGADAVVMVEHTELIDEPDARRLLVTRAVAPGENIAFAGTDVARGEIVLWEGSVVTSREIGVLAAIGRTHVDVVRRPRVAILSTGNEIVPPGAARPPGYVYDSNLAILSAAVEEAGGEPHPLGIVADEEPALEEAVRRALEFDVIVLSGGTSKGAGDLSYRVVERMLQPPGIVAHGVALKPGKPVCLASSAGKPVVILPGFPTSAIFTFHEFVAPVIRRLAGRSESERRVVQARLPMRVNSDRGRTEYLLVGLVRTDSGLAAYPMGKGSGSVTTFSRADGFITIDQHCEILEAGARVEVTLLGRQLEPADLVVIGSHCVGLDVLVGKMQRRGFSTKVLHVGSTGGLVAVKRGECDVAGMHLLDPATGRYNEPFLTPEVELVRGYRRMQCLVFRPGDARFPHRSAEEALTAALADPDCVMVNRNAGSGTRILIDRLLAGKRPPGYAVQARSHNAVAAAVEQRRADWGVAIESVAAAYGLASIPLTEEHYDFAVPKSRRERPAVRAFREMLADSGVRAKLAEMGFRLDGP